MLLYLVPTVAIASSTILHAGFGVWTTIATVPNISGYAGVRVTLTATATGGSLALLNVRGLYTNVNGSGALTADQLGIYEECETINGQALTTSCSGTFWPNASLIGTASFPATSVAIQVLAYDIDPYTPATNTIVSGSYQLISG